MALTEEKVSCFIRTDRKSKDYRCIYLENSAEIVFGRSADAAVSLFTTMVSRRHAVVKRQTNGGWSITDNNSTNGVYVNKKRIPANSALPLKDGDLVRIGVPVKKHKPNEYEWTFYTSYPRTAISKIIENLEVIETNRECLLTTKNNKRTRTEYNDAEAGCSCVNLTPSKPRLKRLCVPEWSPHREYQKKLEEQDRLAQAKLKEQQEKLEEMQKLLKEKEELEEEMKEKLKKKEEEMKVELLKEKEKLMAERKKYEMETRKEYEEQVNSREKALIQKLICERENLFAERLRIENQLQQEMECKLDEKNRQLEADLMQEKQKLDKIIQQKELEHKILQSQLEETKSENLKQKENAFLIKEAVLNQFTNLMETELQCSICNELFIMATSLNCSHSFCALCIEQWMDVKKECPVCRSAVTSHLRSRVLDSYIDKMIEHLSDDLKESRKKLVSERLEEYKKREAAKNPPATTSQARGRHRRQARGRGRAGRGRAEPAQPRQVNAPILVPSNSPDNRVPIMVSDTESGSDNSFIVDDSDSEVSGDEDAYYGGYGVCFRCGRRGHWANGCPE